MVSIPFETADGLNHSTIVHGFFGRIGGVSQELFSSLNTSRYKGDDEANVDENRKRICRTIGIDHMVTLRQVHKNDVLVVDGSTTNSHQMDAMVTKTPGRLLAIQTADCAPVLLADPIAGVVGAIHAGWRGAIAGIVKATVDSMKTLGASVKNINAAIGPCIHQISFEVGAEVFDAANAPTFFIPSAIPGHYLFDLGGYVLNDLKNQGINDAVVLPLNTYALKNQYYSYRRSCHQQKPSCGGQLSVIGLI